MHYSVQFVVLLTFAGASIAHGFAPLSSPQLLESCRAYVDDPQSSSGMTCAVYVGGFLDGASTVAPRALVSRDAQPESFTDRALRTRLGLPRPCEPLYCLDGAITVQQLIADLLEYAEENPPERGMSAREVVEAALQTFHSCPPTARARRSRQPPADDRQ